MKRKRYSSNGFTIVELLIVIVVIAILASISIVTFTGIQQRARDNVRAADLAEIKKALLTYEVMHGGVPTVEAFGGGGLAGWNNSSMSSWLSFMRPDFGNMPVDSINQLNGATDPSGSPSARVYFYYCYPSSSLVEPNKPTVVLGYHKEDSTQVWHNFTVQSCLTSLPG